MDENPIICNSYSPLISNHVPTRSLFKECLFNELSSARSSTLSKLSMTKESIRYSHFFVFFISCSMELFTVTADADGDDVRCGCRMISEQNQIDTSWLNWNLESVPRQQFTSPAQLVTTEIEGEMFSNFITIILLKFLQIIVSLICINAFNCHITLKMSIFCLLLKREISAILILHTISHELHSLWYEGLITSTSHNYRWSLFL